MASQRLTSRFCDTVRVERDTTFPDHEVRGLALRVSPGGAKSWTFTYYSPLEVTTGPTGTAQKRRKRISFGPYPQITLADARQRGMSARSRVARGEDPSPKKLRADAIVTFEQLANRYLERHSRPKRRWEPEDERILGRDVLPLIGSLRLDAITRRDVLDILERVEGRGAMVQAQRTFEVVRGVFRWALAQDYVINDPTAGIKRRLKPTVRTRFLTADEIANFWKGLDSAGMDARCRLALRLQLATGQRINEVCGARKSEFDLKGRSWTIPAARSKNGREHTVPLSELSLFLIEEALAFDAASEWLFPSRPRSRIAAPLISQPLGASAPTKAMKANLAALGLADNPATPHDLRRTVATHLVRLGISESTVSRLLNHVSEAHRTITTAVYVRHSYDAEKRRALDHWACELERIVTRNTAPNMAPIGDSRTA